MSGRVPTYAELAETISGICSFTALCFVEEPHPFLSKR